MIIEGPCKPINDGESDTVRIIMNVGEGARLLKELKGLTDMVGLSLPLEAAALVRGLEGVQKNQLEVEDINCIAETLREKCDLGATAAIGVADAVVRRLAVMRSRRET